MEHVVEALEGVSVLDLASVGPGARASRILADYGASVVKVFPPSKAGSAQIAAPTYAYSALRGMRRAEIDTRSEPGRDAFMRLAEQADVVIESFRPGAAARMGIGFDALRARNPRIVLCSTSGFGSTGPASQWAGHDLDYLAMGGFLACSGRRADGGPALPGATVADIAAGGMHAALAVMAALLRRQRTGLGEHLDVSVTDGVVGMMSLYVEEHLATGGEPGPGHSVLTGKYACYDAYRCRDDRWLAVGAIEARFFANLCRALGRDELVELQYDDDRQDDVRAALTTAFATRDRDDWVAELASADCCVAPVNTIAEVVDDGQVVARRLIVDATRPDGARLRQVGPVWAGAVSPAEPVELPDPQRSDACALLSAAGASDAEIEALVSAGAVA